MESEEPQPRIWFQPLIEWALEVTRDPDPAAPTTTGETLADLYEREPG
jgi:hypothetical protein